jgi:hypothetical protein
METVADQMSATRWLKNKASTLNLLILSRLLFYLVVPTGIEPVS